MRLYFVCKTNKNYVRINTVKFTLRNGTVLTIDRDETRFSIENGELLMEWRDCYIWKIGDCFMDLVVNPHLANNAVKEIKALLSGATAEFEIEDDAHVDYNVEIIGWGIGG